MTIQRNKTKITISLLFSVLFCVGLVLPVRAATLYLDPSELIVPRGETFFIDLRIDTEGECINTVQADLTFSNNILQVVDFSDANSILSIWVKAPKVDQLNGLISFTGGIPGGYCGQIPGDPAKSNLVGKIVFHTAKENIQSNFAQIDFKNAKVLLNDGLGTEAKLTTQDALINLTEPTLLEKIKPKEDEWSKKLKEDKTPPEPFKIQIAQDPQIFDGKYFIVFSTTDKQTGIDYYEIRETPQKLTLKPSKWSKVDGPPYLLQDQTLSSIIEVKVVDRAGNVRVEKIVPEYKRTWRDWLPWVVLILIAIFGWIFLQIKNKKSNIKYTNEK